MDNHPIDTERGLLATEGIMPSDGNMTKTPSAFTL